MIRGLATACSSSASATACESVRSSFGIDSPRCLRSVSWRISLPNPGRRRGRGARGAAPNAADSDQRSRRVASNDAQLPSEGHGVDLRTHREGLSGGGLQARAEAVSAIGMRKDRLAAAANSRTAGAAVTGSSQVMHRAPGGRLAALAMAISPATRVGKRVMRTPSAGRTAGARKPECGRGGHDTTRPDTRAERGCAPDSTRDSVGGLLRRARRCHRAGSGRGRSVACGCSRPPGSGCAEC